MKTYRVEVYTESEAYPKCVAKFEVEVDDEQGGLAILDMEAIGTKVVDIINADAVKED